MASVVEVRPNAYPAPSWGSPRATISAPAEAIFTSRVPGTSFVHRRSPDAGSTASTRVPSSVGTARTTADQSMAGTAPGMLTAEPSGWTNATPSDVRRNRTSDGLPSAPGVGSAPDPDPVASMATANAATVPSTIRRIGGLLPDSGGLDGADVDSVRRSAPGPSGRDERRVRPQWSSPRIVEAQLPRRMPAGPPPALVDEAVVGVAQEHQVVQVGGPAIGPVDQVVGVQPPLPLASGEPAGPSVPVPEHPEEGTGHTPAPPAHPHRAALPLQDPLDPPVAGQPADGIRGKAMAALGLCQPRAPLWLRTGQCFGSCMDHHRGRLRPPGGQVHQGVRESSASTVDGLRVSGDSLGPPLQGGLEGRPLLGREHPLQPQHRALPVPVQPQVPGPSGFLGLPGPGPVVPAALPPQPRRPAV